MATVGVMSIVEYAAAAATVVSAGVEAYSSIQQGNAIAKADKQKAIAAGIQAQQEQIDARRNMLRALASQNAGTLGAVGTGGASGFAANARRQISQSQNDLLVSKANLSAQTSLLDADAASARAAGNLGAAADLISGAAKGGQEFASAYQTSKAGG